MIDSIINTRLLMHPVNWGIVVAVLFLMSYAITHVTEAAGGGCKCHSSETE